MARPMFFKFDWHCVRAAAALIFCTAGSSRPISTAMMAITTKSSTSVKPTRRPSWQDNMVMSFEKEPSEVFIIKVRNERAVRKELKALRALSVGEQHLRDALTQLVEQLTGDHEISPRST